MWDVGQVVYVHTLNALAGRCDLQMSDKIVNQYKYIFWNNVSQFLLNKEWISGKYSFVNRSIKKIKPTACRNVRDFPL